MVRTLLDDQLEKYRRQAENGQLAKSTLEGYEKAINSERMKFWDGWRWPRPRRASCASGSPA